VSALAALDVTFPHLAEIAERLRRVTVEVYGPRGGGAGILWEPHLIVTNAHVVHSPWFRVRLADDSHVEARLVTADPCADLALLRIPPGGITPAAIGDSDALRVGAVVVAFGHPLGLRRTLTAGVVHALPPAPSRGRRWIHADLRVAPGNSGGPLADTAGRVVGINTMIGSGLALAIPANEARRFVARARVSSA
jgi:serine protease Do